MATLSSYLPAGTSKTFRYAVESPSRVSRVAAQSGCQSPGQPSSSWREPTTVAVRSAAWAGRRTAGPGGAPRR